MATPGNRGRSSRGVGRAGRRRNALIPSLGVTPQVWWRGLVLDQHFGALWACLSLDRCTASLVGLPRHRVRGEGVGGCSSYAGVPCSASIFPPRTEKFSKSCPNRFHYYGRFREVKPENPEIFQRKGGATRGEPGRPPPLSGTVEARLLGERMDEGHGTGES
jgi:hypothetical protein